VFDGIAVTNHRSGVLHQSIALSKITQSHTSTTVQALKFLPVSIKDVVVQPVLVQSNIDIQPSAAFVLNTSRQSATNGRV
jgi:hypothetical protein